MTGKVQGTIPLAGPAEVDEAVAAAQAAREGWRRTAPEVRREILIRLADLMEAHKGEFARMGALGSIFADSSAGTSGGGGGGGDARIFCSTQTPRSTGEVRVG